MKQRGVIGSIALATMVLVLGITPAFAQSLITSETEILAGSAARVALTDIIMTSPPPEMLNEEDSDLVQAGWRTPDNSGELTLFANGTFSLARKISGKDIWDDGNFGTEGAVLVLKPTSVGEGVEWRYRLVEFGAVPKRFGLKLETKAAASAPPAVLYDAMQHHFMPSAMPVSLDRGNIELYPIGWSRKGLFAYIAMSYQNDGRAAQQYALTIFDAVQDTVAYEHVIVPSDRPAVDELGLNPLRYVWAYGSAAYHDKLQAMGIIPYRDSGLPAGQKPFGAFPFTSLGATYAASVTLSPPAGTDPVPFSVRRSITVKAQSASKGSKTVTTLKDRRIRNATIAGWLKSPFEDRIAIIVEMQVYERDWESPPEFDASGKPLPDGPITPYYPSTGYFLTGCNLKVGFKK